MVKVKIEVNGEEKKTCKGEAVYAVVMTEDGCQLIMVSEPEQGFSMIHLLKALVALVNNTIETHAHSKVLQFFERGLKQQEIAEIMGVTQSNISRVKRRVEKLLCC